MAALAANVPAVTIPTISPAPANALPSAHDFARLLPLFVVSVMRFLLSASLVGRCRESNTVGRTCEGTGGTLWVR